jgi:putative membrane-bound dehydrogenase-like protein
MALKFTNLQTALGCLVASLLLIAPAAVAGEDASPLGPLDPSKAIASLQLPDDLQIELAAFEPEVVDPVAIRFDERGRMWVAEMRDYPTGPRKAGNEVSRIRVLEDRDGDGRFETATLFADGRSFVTGLQPWKGGVIVTESGKISYLKDEDGDGKVDRDELWFTGFAEGNTQLRANHPRLGVDGFVYVANGLRGGTVVDHRQGGTKAIPINGMDFRFDPRGGGAEAISGVGQFGMTFDDWGNRFVCSNRNPVRHIVIEDRYLKAAPSVALPAVVHDVAAFAEQSRIFPLTRAWTTSNLHAGQFTAACGVFVYRGDALPPAYRGNAFTCDPTGNLVHREIMKRRGPTFTSEAADKTREWLASTDEWFRPVSMELGPDGALYVVDMYRAVIEHPEFMPDELKTRPDLRLGDDRGRIYRVSAKGWNRPKFESSAQASVDELCKQFGTANAWRRETAQRLLQERGVDSRTISRSLPADLGPEGQIHALHLDPSDDRIAESLAAPHPEVRRQAVALAERSLAASNELATAVHQRLSDDAAQVRYQAMLSLAKAKQVNVDQLSAAIQMEDMEDPWMRAAIELSAGDQALDAFLALRQRKEKEDKHAAGGRLLLASLAQRAAAKSPQAAGRVLEEVARRNSASEDEASLAFVLLDAVGRSVSLAAAAQHTSKDDQKVTEGLKQLQILAERYSADQKQEAALRRESIQALAHFPAASSVLAKIAKSEPDQTLRQSAIAALSKHSNREVWSELLAQVSSMTPSVRRSLLEASLGPAERATMLLDCIENGRLKPAELEVLQANRLRQHRDAAVRDRAARLLKAEAAEDRVKALEAYQTSLSMTADAVRGRTVFEKNCATCHRIGELGVNVAPDISDTRTKTAAQLLADIVQPNRAIDNNYIAYNLLLSDGTSATGILSSESTTSITLRQPGDKTLVVSRADIEELRSSGVSLMPEGLEKNIEPQAMADLLSFLKNWRYLDGKTPLGN